MGEIKIIDLEPFSDEWFESRNNYITASEVGAVLGLSKEYTHPARILHEKSGLMEPHREANRHTVSGKVLEPVIAKLWEAWEPDRDGAEDVWAWNFENNNRVRKSKTFSKSIYNTDYPWLSCTIDRLGRSGQKWISLETGLFTEEIHFKEFNIEIKHIDAFYADKFVGGIPPQYVIQIHQQMLILGMEYSELVLWDTRRKLHVYPIYRNQALIEKIIEETHDFYYNQLEPMKALAKELKNEINPLRIEEIKAEIEVLTPLPDESETYEAFLKERYQSSYQEKVIAGNEEMFEDAVQYKLASEEIKEVEKKKQLHKNKLLHALGPNEEIDFGKKGRVTYRASKKGSRTFRANVKSDD